MNLNSKILIIAGSDSSGGAGIQADIKTVTALGSYAMTAITAVTSQNTTGVKSIVGINPKEIFNQIVFSCKDINPDAIKIGMLHSSEVIKMVIRALDVIKVKKIVLDPVMVAKGGAKLINTKAIQFLKLKLILASKAIDLRIETLDTLIFLSNLYSKKFFNANKFFKLLLFFTNSFGRSCLKLFNLFFKSYKSRLSIKFLFFFK